MRKLGNGEWGADLEGEAELVNGIASGLPFLGAVCRRPPAPDSWRKRPTVNSRALWPGAAGYPSAGTGLSEREGGKSDHDRRRSIERRTTEGNKSAR